METNLARLWWMPFVRGLLAIAFGILTFVTPESSLLALVILFGAFALTDGAFNLVMAIQRPRGSGRWGWVVFEGVVGILAGVATFVWPSITALVLLMVIAAWALVTGVAALIAAIKLRRVLPVPWLLGLNGALSMILGVLLFLFPGPGALVMVLWVGAYALVSGVLLVILSLRLRSWRSEPGRSIPVTRPSLA